MHTDIFDVCRCCAFQMFGSWISDRLETKAQKLNRLLMTSAATLLLAYQWSLGESALHGPYWASSLTNTHPFLQEVAICCVPTGPWHYALLDMLGSHRDICKAVSLGTTARSYLQGPGQGLLCHALSVGTSARSYLTGSLQGLIIRDHCKVLSLRTSVRPYL